VPEGHDPDPVGRPWLAVVIFVIFAVALAAIIFAVALVVFRAAASGILRKL
jgi:hypothetical protein